MMMIQDRLGMELERVASRYRRLRFWWALAIAWFLAALCGALVWRTGWMSGVNSGVTVTLLCIIAAACVGVCLWKIRSRAGDRTWLAHRVEAEYPELATCLLAAVEQQPQLPDGRFGFLQANVIRQSLVHAELNDWPTVVSGRRIAVAVISQFLTLGLFVTALVAATTWVTPKIAAGLPGHSKSESAGEDFSVVVEPGNAEVERGTSLLVMARMTGEMPPDAALVVSPVEGEAARIEMSRSLEDPLFGGRIENVQEDTDYHVELAGHITPTYRVTVFEYPRLETADARLVYPKYTAMEERLVQDVRTLSVVEGTQLTLICHLNKRVATATLVDKENKSIALTSVEGDKPDYQTTIRCEKSLRLRLDLVDDAGRKNVRSSEIVIQVVPNQPPTLKPVFPARDVEVSALEELDLKATVWDDFGLKRMGVAYSLAGKEPVEVVLGNDAAGKQRHELANTTRLEELQAEPDQLLSYFFWAEDFGPDGNVRRTSSDMYFAEVRQFEEIFRQGQQQPGGQQQNRQQQQQQQGGGANAQAAQQLAQLQKDIINATWKVIRREITTKLTDAFAGDTQQIAESQASALEQAQTLAERIQDPESQEHAAAVLEAMTRAVSQLKSAHDQPSADPLKPALAAEQSAYQGLLKLRAREHEVVRQQQQQQQQQSQSSRNNSSARSQQQRQQLQQLDLSKEENRYETQRTARSQPQEQEDRETRQVLNRLRELAQRQHDLNERLKDLQTALQEAQTEEKREEVRRQLKRLQEEQQQILRDTDELKSRMETPENQERMSDERQQLEQTRDQVRRASESLDREMVTQAAASGTRAEKEFEDLRNEFRRRASGRFNEDMREMRDAARELDRRQQELSEQLKEAATPDPAKKSLREDGAKEQVVKGLADQKQRLNNLTEQMRRTIQDAEQTEPLLSERLYETARNLQNQNPDRALDATNRSLRQGLLDDARQQERAAGRGITQAREGIEKAAESVLGDETESLRRAREELRNLSEELNREIARNSPDDQQERQQSGQRPRESGAASQDQNQRQDEQTDAERNRKGQPQPGNRDQKNQNQPNGQRPSQPGQSGQRPGERPDGQPQPGERPNGRGESQDRQPGNQRPGTGAQQPGSRQPREPGENQQQPNQPQQENRQQPGTENGQSQPGSQPRGQRNPTGGTTGGPGNPRGDQRLTTPVGPGGNRPFDETVDRERSPIAGEDFRDWSDRLRDVEEMVADPELRAEAARIRERARGIRTELKRHSKSPQWDLVRTSVAEPLVELSNRVAEELLRRESRQAVVPLDRDPVPPRYSEKSRRYYERLGSGK